MALFLAGLATAEQASVGSAPDLLAKTLLRLMQGLLDRIAIIWEQVNKARSRWTRSSQGWLYARERAAGNVLLFNAVHAAKEPM